jgi:hypothetical protein
LLADVTLLPELDPEAVRIGVRWQTGASDELTVERRGPGRTPPEALAIVREFGATYNNVQIAKMLNDAGLKTGKNLLFTPRHVAGVRGIYKIFTPRTMAVREDEISVKQAAQILGIPADAVYNWIRHEQVPARPGPGGRWCIPWALARRRSTARRSQARSDSSQPRQSLASTTSAGRTTCEFTGSAVPRREPRFVDGLVALMALLDWVVAAESPVEGGAAAGDGVAAKPLFGEAELGE